MVCRLYAKIVQTCTVVKRRRRKKKIQEENLQVSQCPFKQLLLSINSGEFNDLCYVRASDGTTLAMYIFNRWVESFNVQWFTKVFKYLLYEIFYVHITRVTFWNFIKRYNEKRLSHDYTAFWSQSENVFGSYVIWMAILSTYKC